VRRHRLDHALAAYLSSLAREHPFHFVIEEEASRVPVALAARWPPPEIGWEKQARAVRYRIEELVDPLTAGEHARDLLRLVIHVAVAPPLVSGVSHAPGVYAAFDAEAGLMRHCLIGSHEAPDRLPEIIGGVPLGLTLTCQPFKRPADAQEQGFGIEGNIFRLTEGIFRRWSLRAAQLRPFVQPLAAQQIKPKLPLVIGVPAERQTPPMPSPEPK